LSSNAGDMVYKMNPPTPASDTLRLDDVDTSDIDEGALLGSSQKTSVQNRSGDAAQTSTPQTNPTTETH